MKHSKLLFRTSLISSALVISGISVFAQTSPSPSPSASASPAPSNAPSNSPSSATALATLNNAVLVNFLHHMNIGEITEANDALQRLTSQQARSFAQTMINDHQQNEQQVTQVANQKSLVIYAYQPSTLDVAVDSQLQELDGTSYDLAYLQVQLMEHQRALRDLQSMQSQVTDSDLRNLITQTIPVIQNHISLANTAISQLQGGAGAGSASPTPNASSSPAPSTSASPTSSGTPQM